MIFDRDISYIRNFWDSKDQTKSGFLSRDEALEVLHSVIKMHWKDEIAGLSESEKDHYIVTFCNLADKEGKLLRKRKCNISVTSQNIEFTSLKKLCNNNASIRNM